MTTAIRKATLKDIPALLVLEEKSFLTDRMTAQHFRSLLRSPSVHTFVAVQNRVIIGCIMILTRKNSKKARLYSIAIDQQYRKQGIAQRLADFIERKLKRQHFAEIYLEVHTDNLAAIRFYEKNHYHVFGKYRRFYEDGADAIRMRKSLPNVKLK